MRIENAGLSGVPRSATSPEKTERRDGAAAAPSKVDDVCALVTKLSETTRFSITIC